MTQDKSAMEVLAANVKQLLAKSKWSENELGRRSRVDPKTINNIVNCRTAATIDSLDAIARAFKLKAWRLLMDEKLTIDDGNGEVENLIENFQKTDETGRHSILSVAELAARPYRE